MDENQLERKRRAMVAKYISADDLMHILNVMQSVEGTSYCRRLYGKVMEQVKDMPAADVAPRWIPCSERLPERKRAHYWVCTDVGYQCECRWTDNRFGLCNSSLSGEWGWSIFDIPRYSKAIAWMPLPEPYKMDESTMGQVKRNDAVNEEVKP